MANARGSRRGETLAVPSWAPAGATPHRTRGSSGELRHDGRVLARLCWNDDGVVVLETPLDDQGREHGLYRELDDDGRVVWQQPFVHGIQHGTARHFDRRGRLLMTSRFVHGAGVDIYCQEDGAVAELREFRDNVRHGLERWGDPSRPYSEEWLYAGRPHGIERRWAGARLEPGYPKYFVDGLEVTRESYRVACRTRPELPRDLRREDHPKRALPSCLTDGRVKLFPRPKPPR